MSKYTIGATVVKSGRILATGQNKVYNRFIVHGVSKHSEELWKMNRCAEKGVIERILRQQDGLKHLGGAVIYVTRFNKTGNTRLAKPCSFCMELIQSVGIKRVVYTTADGTNTIKL